MLQNISASLCDHHDAVMPNTENDFFVLEGGLPLTNSDYRILFQRHCSK